MLPPPNRRSKERTSPGLGLGFIGFIGFIGFMGFIGFVGFVGFIGFVGFVGFVGLIGFVGFIGLIGFIGFRVQCLGFIWGYRVLGFRISGRNDVRASGSGHWLKLKLKRPLQPPPPPAASKLQTTKP